jgi:restriction system protein
MGRRRNGGLFEVLATLPWWVGLLLAVFSYGILHHYATVGIHPLVKGWAAPMQYVVPAVLFASAVASAIGRWRRSRLVAGVLDGPSASAIREMRWQDFELLVGEGFRLQGFLVIESGGGGADGGVDLVLQKGEEKFFVQCKHWRALKVDVGTVRELYGVMAAKGAAGGFVVTSGDFTAAAAEFAGACGIRLLNGSKLIAMLEKAKATVTMPLRIEPRLGAGQPTCPRCSRTMVQRVAKQGASAGKPFWGCPAFPECRGTLPI